MNIKLTNVCKAYKKNGRRNEILKSFSHYFEQGKLVVIKGDSGRGKTTLLSLLALLQKEDSGEIYFDGRLVSRLSSEERCIIRSKEIGIVFQDYNLLEGLTVMENIILADVVMRKLSKKAAEETAMKYISLFGLEHRIHHYPSELSGGEQQRVGIIRAMVKDPDLLICDEPVSNLDSDNSHKIVEFLHDYSHRRDKLVIVSSHNSCFEQYADTVIEL
ncbi:ABC transporter ATP-binding protein [Clostridium thermarum]|uniref:ABC transporter ATP-binding protein n=1 Tax=Clostridium thermarum TaxID=1716543 RepID=UPI0013D3FD00|nr:ABC transporter ATP-binding protein [Clostridium thermarum]